MSGEGPLLLDPGVKPLRCGREEPGPGLWGSGGVSMRKQPFQCRPSSGAEFITSTKDMQMMFAARGGLYGASQQAAGADRGRQRDSTRKHRDTAFNTHLAKSRVRDFGLLLYLLGI